MLPAADVQAPQSSCCSVKYSSVFVQAHIQRGDLLLIQMIYQFVSMINKCNVGNVCLRSDIETVKHNVRNVTIRATHYGAQTKQCIKAMANPTLSKYPVARMHCTNCKCVHALTDTVHIVCGFEIETSHGLTHFRTAGAVESIYKASPHDTSLTTN